jgi:hypothetical protein
VFEGRNRRLLFRSWVLLVGGLLLVAIVLDLGFGYLQSREQPDVDRWLVDVPPRRETACHRTARPACAACRRDR